MGGVLLSRFYAFVLIHTVQILLFTRFTCEKKYFYQLYRSNLPNNPTMAQINKQHDASLIDPIKFTYAADVPLVTAINSILYRKVG